MPPTPPPRRGLSTRHFAWIFGGLLLLLTLFQMTRQQPQRFEPPPSSTSAEIGDELPPPAPEPARSSSVPAYTPPTQKQESAAGDAEELTAETTVNDSYTSAPDLSGLGEESSTVPAEIEPDKVYTYVEQMPQPPGGMAGLMQYINKNLRYPAAARRSAVEGKVFVRFVVRPDGRLNDFEVIKGLGAGCDEEAVRIFRQMPAWAPGKQNGRLVSVSFTVPVTFVLQ